MADNVGIQTGAGATIASDEISGAHYQRVKLIHGADGTNDGDVSDANPLPVDDAGGSLTVDNAALSVTGGGVQASALRVTIASDSTGVLSVDDNAGSLTVDNAALSVTGGGVESSALRVTIASDSTGLLSVDDGGDSLSVDNAAHDDLNANANIQVGNSDVSSSNPVPVIFAAGKVSYAKVAGTTIASSATAYTAGDLIGTKITLSGFVGAAGVSYFGTLRKVSITLASTTTIADIDVIMFDSDPSSTTFTDNAAFSIAAADAEKQIVGIRFSSGDFAQDVNKTAVATKELNLPIQGSSTDSIYVALIAQGGLDMVGSNNISAVFAAEKG